MEMQEIVTRLNEANQIFQGVGAPFRRSLVALLEGGDLAGALAAALSEGQRELEALNKKIEDTKVAELARADQAEADHDLKVAQLRETLAHLQAEVTEQSKKAVALDVEIASKQATVTALDSSLAAHAAKVAGVTV